MSTDERYNDIFNLPYPASLRHPRMSRENRAAQFAPYAALVGYDAAVRESARRTDHQSELSDDEQSVLNEQLLRLMERINEQPEAAITYFCEDARKEGGAYVTTVGTVKKVDVCERKIVLTDGRSIAMDCVNAIEGEKRKGGAEDARGLR